MMRINEEEQDNGQAEMHSLDGVERNIDKIGKLLPNCITEIIGGQRETEEGYQF